MKEKVKCVLLVDDDDATNYMNEKIIGELNCTEKIISMESGKAALNFLKSNTADSEFRPDFIFIDINMPAMNGWEFLDQYKELPNDQKAKKAVVMLTTSINPCDRQRAQSIPVVKEFLNKPLDEEAVKTLFESWEKN